MVFLGIFMTLLFSQLVFSDDNADQLVRAVPQEVTVSDGNFLYIRLETPTPQYDSCRLLGPDGNVASSARIDENFINSCGFIVSNIRPSDQGTWTIVYGSTVTFRATTEVTVSERWTSGNNNIVLALDRTLIDRVVGPEDAVYCRVEDPNGIVVFEGFGRCRVIVEQVTMEHVGMWKMTFGMPGRIRTDESTFFVDVYVPAQRALATTSVHKEQPQVFLTCSVASTNNVTACKFRDPAGRILLANSGVGEDRYRFHGAGVNMDNTNTHECGLRIVDPQTEDLGLWRCAVETQSEVFYGFLTVICPWAMMDPNVAAVVQQEPVLVPQRTSVSAVEHHSTVLSCSVSSPIRYCYFRARNGTIFNVFPRRSAPAGILSLEPVGAGLDAGECGVRLPAMQLTDAGPWTCHVGFPNHTMPEQRASIDVHVEELMSAHQTVVDGWMRLEARVRFGRALEYCRFVRMDGMGFTHDNVPSNYVSHSDIANGLCSIHIQNPSILEVHPWSVVARIKDQVLEFHQMTSGSFDTFLPSENGSSFSALWIVLIVVLVLAFFFAILLVPKRNREWTCCRAAALRRSFRKSSSNNSLHKEPLPNNNIVNNNTALAA